jgi:phage-related protein
VAQQAYAYVTLIPVAEGFQKAIAKEMGGVGNIGETAGKDAGGGLQKGFGKAIAGLAGIIAGAFTVRAITNFAKDSLLAAEAVSTADARIRNINSTMGLFGSETDAVSQRLIDFAKSNEILLAVDENVIKSTQAKLLTFGALAATAGEVGGAFDRATMAAIDLEAAGFGAAEQQAVALGKALNDPIKGLAALGKSGITFTDAEKEKIRVLQESGDLLGAQNILLDAIEGQVQGTAAATADASVQMGLAFGNIKEAVGAELLPIFNDLVQEMLPIIDEVIPVFGETIQALAPVIKDLAAQFPELLRSLFPIIPIIGELAGIFLNLAAQLLPVIVDLFDALMPAIRDLLPIIADFIGEAMEVLVPILVDLIAALIPIVQALLPVFMDLFRALAPVVINLISAFMPIIMRVLPILIGLIEFLTPIMVTVANIMGVIIVGAIGFFVDAISWLIENLAGFGTFFRDLFNGIRDFFVGIINGMITGFEGFVNSVIRGINFIIGGLNKLSVDIPATALSPAVKFGVNIPTVPLVNIPRIALAEGGFVNQPTSALIGEAGPEVVMPLDRFERLMGIGADQGPSVNYYAAPNKSFDAEQELLLAMKRVRILA